MHIIEKNERVHAQIGGPIWMSCKPILPCGCVIIMPMLLYRSRNLLTWTWFKYLNLNIYMMHKIILQIKKNPKSHGLLNSKFMDYSSNYHFFVDYDTVHWLMGCVLGLEISKIS
jgi:hypothetical protein